VRYLDHSDHYTPQGINSVIKLKFENVDERAIVCIKNCGTMCDATTSKSSMSSRMYSVWDWDGSLSRTNVPTILGSNIAWWNVDDSCTFNDITKLWSCPWINKRLGIGKKNQVLVPSKNKLMTVPNRTVVYIEPYIPYLMDGCDYAKFVDCTDQYASYTVGRMSQWGSQAIQSSKYIDLGPWAGVSGMSSIGWYWRVKAPAYGIDGAPSYFTTNQWQQMSAGSFVVLAIAYPANTQFTVTIDYWGSSMPATPMAASLSSVLNPVENLKPVGSFTCDYSDWWNWWLMCDTVDSGGEGFKWYFDGSYLYLRIVPFACYTRNTYERNTNCNSYYEAYDAKVWSIKGGYRATVSATCAGCAVQSTYQGITYYTVNDVPPSRSIQSYNDILLPTSSPTKVPTLNPAFKTSNPTSSPITCSTYCIYASSNPVPVASGSIVANGITIQNSGKFVLSFDYSFTSTPTYNYPNLYNILDLTSTTTGKSLLSVWFMFSAETSLQYNGSSLFIWGPTATKTVGVYTHFAVTIDLANQMFGFSSDQGTWNYNNIPASLRAPVGTYNLYASTLNGRSAGGVVKNIESKIIIYIFNF
jgi:hypothetical protein